MSFCQRNYRFFPHSIPIRFAYVLGSLYLRSDNLCVTLKILFDMSKDNMLLGYARGKVGSLVFARRLGQQVTRAYNAKPKDAATKAQVEQRVRIANVVAMYRAIKAIANHSFEGATGGQTSYNLFVQSNLTNNTVVLTKEAAALGACVVAPYIVSRGTMPSVIVSGMGADAVTNISVGNLSISGSTTVSAFAAALVDNNSGLQYGDQLTYLSLLQQTDSNTGYPVVTAQIYEVTLLQDDNTPLRTYMPEVATMVRNGLLAHGALIGLGGFCWIVSRKNADGSLSVSTQRIILTSQDVAAQYSGATAVTRAIGSYGFNADQILVPDSSGQTGSTSGGGGTTGTPSVSSVSLGGTTLVAGSTSSVSVASGSVRVIINGSSLSSVDDVSVKINGTAYDMSIDGSPTATQITGTITTQSTITATTVGIVIGGSQLYSWAKANTGGGGSTGGGME